MHRAASHYSLISNSRPQEQRGQVLLFLLILVLGVGVALVVSGASSEVSRVLQAEAATREILAVAKQALIGRAVADLNHPGSLPCPDTDDDGAAESTVGVPGGACPSYIGRLPWRTLGIGDLRDDAGERLWYALSPNFRDYAAIQINSDTHGERTVYSGTVAVTLATEAAAVIFAPGLAFANQRRDGVSAACSTTGTTIANSLCAANYLESDSASPAAWNNASAAGPYMSAQRSTAFNDRVAILRASDFMPLVEQRVGRELRDALIAYHTATRGALPPDCAQGCYPWPDSNNDGASDIGSNRGRVPLAASGSGTGAQPYDWGRAITGITKASPGVITTASPHGFTDGQQVYLSSIAGMVELNNQFVTVTVVASDRFSIGLSTTGYGTYSSGGVAGNVLINAATGVRYPLPALPRYFGPNNWQNVIYYTVGRDALQNFGLAPTVCTTCTFLPMLKLDDVIAYSVAFITPGAVAPGATRTAWTQYIDDSRNSDGAPPAVCSLIADACDAYNKPTAKVLNRDRLFSIAGVLPPLSCAPNAQALIANAPCHTTGNNVKPVCQYAADNLSACSCYPAAAVMLDEPCRNTLNPPDCEAAVAQLQACNT